MLTEGGFSGEIPDFNISCNLSVLRVNLPEGGLLDLDLHLDDQIRIVPRSRGLDDVPRAVAGTIEVTDRARAVAKRNPAAERFIEEHFGAERFTSASIEATTGEISIPSMGWKFERRAASAAGVCVTDPGFKKLRVRPSGRDLRFDLDTATESPAGIEVSRVAANGKLISRSVERRLVRTGSFTLKDRRPKRADGIYKVRVTSTGRGGRDDVRHFAFARKNGRYSALPGYVKPPDCELIREFGLSGPAFGGRGKGRPLGFSLRTAETAAVKVVLKSKGKLVRVVKGGRVDPFTTHRASTPARGLKPGVYKVEARANTAGGRTETVVLGAIRL